MIELKTGTRIWIAAGFTDLRRGFQGLSSIVETVLEELHRIEPLMATTHQRFAPHAERLPIVGLISDLGRSGHF